MSDPIKRGDVVTLAWDLSPTPTGATGARVIIAKRGQTPIVSRAATLATARVSITLTALETAVAGLYQVEVETTPGPLTYPNDGCDTLMIEEDLDIPAP